MREIREDPHASGAERWSTSSASSVLLGPSPAARHGAAAVRREGMHTCGRRPHATPCACQHNCQVKMFKRTSVEIGNHRNALLRHKGRVNQVEEIIPVPQEGASLRTGACNRAEHQRRGGMTHFDFPFHSRNRCIASC